jgi:hypothetical protein
VLVGDTRCPGPRNACPYLAVGIPGVETPSRRKRSVSRRPRRMARCLVRLRLLGCSVAVRGVCRRTNPGGRRDGVVTAESGMRPGMAAGTRDGEEEKGRRRQEVGARPFRLLSSTVAAPFGRLRDRAQREVLEDLDLRFSAPLERRRVFRLAGSAQSPASSCWAHRKQIEIGGLSCARWRGVVGFVSRTKALKRLFCAPRIWAAPPVPILSCFGPLGGWTVAGSQNPLHSWEPERRGV